MNDSTNAYSTLYKIPVYFELDSEQELEYDLYEDLLDLKRQIKSDTIFPDNVVIAGLFDIEENNNTMPGVYARNLFISLDELDYYEPIYFPDFTKTSVIEQNIWYEEQNLKKHFKINPNPTREYITIEYNLDYGLYNPLFEIITLIGATLLSFTTFYKQGVHNIDIRDWKPGTYIISLISNSKTMQSEMLTVYEQVDTYNID